MNLKESYRYANYLDNLYETAQRHLYDKAFTTTTKQNHLRKRQIVMRLTKLLKCQNPMMWTTLQMM